MLGIKTSSGASAVLNALSASLAIIEFDLTGKILGANGNFCRVLGYSLSEIKGKHHSLFVDPAEVGQPEYKAFWLGLNKGEVDAGE